MDPNPKENLKITINGQIYARLEDVPEQYRELIQAQMKAALGQPGVNISVKKHIQIGGGLSGPGAPAGQPSPLRPSGLGFLQTLVPWALIAFLLYMLLKHWR